MAAVGRSLLDVRTLVHAGCQPTGVPAAVVSQRRRERVVAVPQIVRRAAREVTVVSELRL